MLEFKSSPVYREFRTYDLTSKGTKAGGCRFQASLITQSETGSWGGGAVVRTLALQASGSESASPAQAQRQTSVTPELGSRDRRTPRAA